MTRKSLMTMAKVGCRALLLPVLAFALASCAAVEEIPFEEGTQQKMNHIVLSASLQESAAVRTSLNEDCSVSFKQTDEITVFSGTEGYTFKVASISEDGLTATFEGDIIPAESYYALYPKDESAWISDDGSIVTTLPSVQTATPGSFADGASISVARSSGGKLEFRNVGAIVSISVMNDAVSSVKLESGTVLSGSAAISLVDGVPSASFVEGECSVTLDGGLEKAKKYYFVVYPGAHANGLTLTFTDAGGRIAVLTNPKSCEFKANGNVFLGAISIPDTKWEDGYLLSGTVGIYDTDADLALYAFDKYADQLAWVVDEHNSFRMQNLNKLRYVEIYDIPSTYEVGDSFDVRVLQNYVETLGGNYFETVKVEKIKDGLVWLKGKGSNGYIIKK